MKGEGTESRSYERIRDDASHGWVSVLQSLPATIPHRWCSIRPGPGWCRHLCSTHPCRRLRSEGGYVLALSTLRHTTMADIDISRLNIDQLTELVGKAQTEVASRDKQAAQGPQERARSPARRGRLRAGRHLSGAHNRLRERQPASEEACEVPESAEPRTGLVRHRADAEVGAGDTERTGDRSGGVQGDSDVPDSRVKPRLRDHSWKARENRLEAPDKRLGKADAFPVPR